MAKLIGFAAGIFAILLVVWFGFVQTKGNHLAPSGWISDVRTQALAEDVTLAVIDFGVLNDSDQDMIAGTIDPWITTRGGNNVHGSLYSASDMPKTFQFYPKLGDQRNPVLKLRGTIEGHKKKDLMVAVEFDVPQRLVDARRSMTLKITDITGPELEMTGE